MIKERKKMLLEMEKVILSCKYILGAIGGNQLLAYSQKFNCDFLNQQTQEIEDQRPPTSILLLGKTGNGKSSLGNQILGKNFFKTSDGMDSETRFCKREAQTVFGRKMVVVDTPGLTDTRGRKTEDEIAKVLLSSPQGYDALLIVLKYENKMTPEEANVLEKLELFFGVEIKNHAIVVMTNGDMYKAKNKDLPFETFLEKQRCYDDQRFAGKWILFDNMCRDPNERYKQIKALINEIDDISEKNFGQRYTGEIFKEAQEILRKAKMEEERKEAEKKAFREVREAVKRRSKTCGIL